jgi:hypothetical protein
MRERSAQDAGRTEVFAGFARERLAIAVERIKAAFREDTL